MILWLTGFSWVVLLRGADPLPSSWALDPSEAQRPLVLWASELCSRASLQGRTHEHGLMEPRLVWNWLPPVTGPSLASSWEVGKQRQASPEVCVLGALIAHSPQPFFLGKSPQYVVEQGSSQAWVHLPSFHRHQCCWAWRPGV